MKKSVVVAIVVFPILLPLLLIGAGVLLVATLLNNSNQAAFADPCINYRALPESGYGVIEPGLLPDTLELTGSKAELFGAIVAQAQSMSKGGSNAAAIAGMVAYAESKIGRTDIKTIATDIDSYHGIFQQAPTWFPDFPREVFGTESDPRNNPAESSKRYLWAQYDIISGTKKSQHETPAMVNSALETIGVSPKGTPEQRWAQFEKIDLTNVFKQGNTQGLNAFLILSNAVQGHLTQGGILAQANYNHPSSENFKNAFNAMAPQMKGLYGSRVIPVSGVNQASSTGALVPADFDASQESFIGDSFFTKNGILSGPDFPESAHVDARSGQSLGDWVFSSREKPARTKLSKKTGSVTVSLGYGDTKSDGKSYSSKIDQFMNIVGTSRPVYWYTLHSIKEGSLYYDTKINLTYDSHNKNLREAAQRHPNLVVLESGSIIDKKPLQYISSDGLNLTPAGYALMWEIRQGKADISYIASPNATDIPADCLASLGTFGAQQLVGLDGLPLDAPAIALKDGLSQEDFLLLSQNAVSNAGTAQAALAIKWALTNLGIPYACSGAGGRYNPAKIYLGVSYSSQYVARAGPNAYDCSSYVNRAYRDGAGMTDVSLVGTTEMGRAGRNRQAVYKPVDRRQMQPGDLIVYNSMSGDSGGHVMMYLGQSPATRDEEGRLVQSDDEWVTDTGTCGDVSRVKKLDRSYVSGLDKNWNVVRPMPTNKKSQDSISKKVIQPAGGTSVQ